MYKSNQDDLSKLHNIRLPTKKIAIVSRLPPSASSFKLHVLKAGKQRHGVITNKYGSRFTQEFPEFLCKQWDYVGLCCNNTKLMNQDKKLRCCQCPSGSSPQTGSHRVLHVDQLDILLDEHGQKLPCHCLLSTRPYCCSLAKPSVTTNDLDITLARCLLVNFSTICSPGSPIRHAVDVIKDYRNKSYGHAREAKMSASDFQNNVANVETAILSIAKVCNVEIDMKQKLQDAKNRSLDPTLCIQYQNLLLHEMHKNLLMISQIQSHHKLVDEKLQTHFQETTSMFSDFRITQEERAEIFIDRVEDAKREIQEQHDKLQTHVDKTNVNIVTSNTDTRNVIQKNMNDFETRLHHHIDDAMLQAVKKTPTGI
ncbi:unnamed protein product [Mytilus edulis]|uniref:Uncharacterized protein n=1 Tax=Mytilus edulis TaxID=6550 RepID=A0A8S3VI76_MYTED|nr:unnamed protein product [Mytilus edulis]